jgi:hypothetical protein
MTPRADYALEVLRRTTPGGYGSRVNSLRIREFIEGGEYPVLRVGSRTGRVVAVTAAGETLTIQLDGLTVEYVRRRGNQLRRRNGEGVRKSP